QGVLSDEEDGFVRWKVTSIVFELDQIERRNAPIGRVAGDQIDLVRSQRRVRQIKGHLVRRIGKTQTVSVRKAGIAIRPRHKILAEAGAPLRRVRRGV